MQDCCNHCLLHCPVHSFSTHKSLKNTYNFLLWFTTLFLDSGSRSSEKTRYKSNGNSKWEGEGSKGEIRVLDCMIFTNHQGPHIMCMTIRIRLQYQYNTNVGCRGRADKSTKLMLWCFCFTECGFRIPVVTLVSLSKTLNYNCFSPPRGNLRFMFFKLMSDKLKVPNCLG